MPRVLGLLITLNIALLVWNGWDASTYAQRPPETNADGVPFLKVNINPTAVPPAVNINPSATPPVVNINPQGRVARVEVSNLNEIDIPAPGCDRRTNFETAVGRTVEGPIQLSFLNISQPAAVRLVTPGGQLQVTLNQTPQLGSAIYLGVGQRLEFDAAVLYSGCRPAR